MSKHIMQNGFPVNIRLFEWGGKCLLSIGATVSDCKHGSYTLSIHDVTDENLIAIRDAIEEYLG